MTDIVHRLLMEGALAGSYDVPALQREAADVIEMLRENMQNLVDEVERLRDALTEIEYLDRPQVRGKPRRVSIQEIALAALEIKND